MIMSIVVEVIYNHRSNQVEIYADGKECNQIDYLQNRDIPSWFEKYSNAKLCWKGLIMELEELLGYSVENMEFDFQGDENSKGIFIQCLQKKNVQFAQKEEKPKVNPLESLENGNLFEKSGKIEQAMGEYQVSADLGNIEACYHYGKLLGSEEALPYILKSANGGQGEAQFLLANRYKIGDGVEQNDVEAIVWFEKASKQEITEADYYLGEYRMDGEFLPRHSKLAKDYFQKAADSGFELAQVELACCYFHGRGVAQNREIAVMWWEKSIENPKSQYFLGLCYYKGDSVAQDTSKAIELLEKSAKSGFIEAVRKLAEIYLGFDEKQRTKGIQWLEQGKIKRDVFCVMELVRCYYEGLGVERDYKKAIDLFSSARREDVKKKEFAPYYVFIGNCYYEAFGVELDKEKARDYYEISGNLGYVPAQTKLGLLYESSLCTKESGSNYVKSVEWYEKAAEQFDTEAMASLGRLYETRKIKGLSGKESLTKAFEWYQKAGRYGNMIAQYKLGIFYAKAWDVKRDYTLSAYWYEKAAKQGHSDAQYQLGECYYYAHGVEKDFSASAYWYEKSANQGHEKARKDLHYSLKKTIGATESKNRMKQLSEEWRENENTYEK